MENNDKDKPPVPVGNSIEELFKAMALRQKSEAENQVKDMDDYKFWKTQPVPRLGDQVDQEGPIDVKTVDQVSKEPFKLPGEFQWCTVNIENPEELAEVYDLLYNNYIEDDDEEFRFKYSPRFLEWALKCPGWYKEWMVGVRVAGSNKLVAFISGVPTKIRVRDNDPFNAAEINFLCVHKRLRSKRLAPVLIREVTRRVNLKGIWQALYTGGKILPSPISTARYYHRPLNFNKLYNVGFSGVPDGSTPAKEEANFALPLEPTCPGWRKMVKNDVTQVKNLLQTYLSRFDIVSLFTEEEIEHWFLDPCHTNEEDLSTICSYVVETDGEITDLVSFFGIESTVLGKSEHKSLDIAYSFYYATKTGISEDGKRIVDEPALKKRLILLNSNALISAKSYKYDVYNSLTAMDNNQFLKELKFREGSGFLRYYLFNYRAFPIPGGVDRFGDLVNSTQGGIGVLLF